MFDEFSIVTTAISSFNNAALYNPYFFAVGLLTIPVFYMVYMYGRDIVARFNFKTDTGAKIGFWSVLFLVFWFLVFGGNYAVMRDGISLLPTMIAFVLFFSMMFVTHQAIKLDYVKFLGNKRTRLLVFLSFVVFGVLSAKPDLFGILLQLSAILCGAIVGARLHKKISSLFMSTVIFGMSMILILMQPEYFRFGQLGNLTLVHLGSILIAGFFTVTALVANYTNSCSKISESAYIKIKWLFRIIASLALVLFALTESVPVFIGLLAVVSLSEMLTIYHSKQSFKNIAKQSWAMMLVCFGILIICPVITCLGLVYLSNLSNSVKAKNFIRLL